jgi:hypothetical protein
VKWFEILQGRIDGQDKYTFNFHNPLWALFGFAAGAILGIGIGRYWCYVERLVSQ